MERYEIGQKIENGFDFDNRDFKYGDRVITIEDILINNEPFFDNVVVPKGSIGTIEGLDIERRTAIRMVDNKPIPIIFRGHKVRFDMFDDIKFFDKKFNLEIEPYKLEKNRIK